MAGLYAGFSLLSRRWMMAKIFGGLVAIVGFASAVWPVEYDGADSSSRVKLKVSQAAENLRISTDETLLLAMNEAWSKTGARLAHRLTASVPTGIRMLCVMTDDPDEPMFALGRIVPALGLP